MKKRTILSNLTFCLIGVSAIGFISSIVFSGAKNMAEKSIYDKVEELSKTSAYYEEYVEQDLKDLTFDYESGVLSQQTYLNKLDNMNDFDYKRNVVFNLPDTPVETVYNLIEEQQFANKAEKTADYCKVLGFATLALSTAAYWAMVREKD